MKYARGAHGIAGLSRKFRIADDDNSGTLNLAEFSKMSGEHTLGWTPEQTKLMFDHFDKDHSGTIVFDEFLVTIRGQLNDRRRQLVLMAFEVMAYSCAKPYFSRALSRYWMQISLVWWNSTISRPNMMRRSTPTLLRTSAPPMKF